MNVQLAKVIGTVATLIALLAALIVAIRFGADNIVVGVLGTAVGTGAAAAFRWFTGSGDDKGAGAGAVLVVAGAILAAEQGCTPPASAAAAAAEGAYTAELLQCVDEARTLEESRLCRQIVNLKWGISETVTDGGAQ